MRTLLVLVMLTSFAAAERVAPKIRANTSTCKPNGAVWFEIELWDSSPTSKTVRLYANGATTTTRKTGKKQQVTNGRCLPPREMSYVEQLLKSTTWKITNPPMRTRCENQNNPPGRTVVRVFGKRVFSEYGCDPDTLDEQSAKALDELRMKVGAIKTECLENPLAKGCT